jgi:hypothetical protein
MLNFLVQANVLEIFIIIYMEVVLAYTVLFIESNIYQMFGMFTTKFSWIVPNIGLREIDVELFWTSHNVSKMWTTSKLLNFGAKPPLGHAPPPVTVRVAPSGLGPGRTRATGATSNLLNLNAMPSLRRTPPAVTLRLLGRSDF